MRRQEEEEGEGHEEARVEAEEGVERKDRHLGFCGREARVHTCSGRWTGRESGRKAETTILARLKGDLRDLLSMEGGYLRGYYSYSTLEMLTKDALSSRNRETGGTQG